MNINLKAREFGLKNDSLIKTSLFISKHLHYNLYTIPKIKTIKLIFPLLFTNTLQNRIKILLMILFFLEQITSQKSIIKKVQIISDENMWMKYQVTLHGFNLFKFILFFSEFLQNHPLLRYSYKLPYLKRINSKALKLFIFDMDLFFPNSLKRYLPDVNYYWFELEFKINNNFKCLKKTNLDLYTQLFFNHNLLEWQPLIV